MKLNQVLMMTGLAVALTTSASKLQAQNNPPPKKDGGGEGQGRGEGRGGRGNFDPSRFQEMMMNGIRDRLGIKDDTEWKAIEPLVTKVNEARREATVGGMRGMMGGFGGGRGPGGGGTGGGDNNSGGDRNRGRGGFGGIMGEPSPEEEALAKAVEAKAPKAELKTKMAAFRKVKQANEAKLKDAQENLKKVLTVEQEAAALQMGLVQ